MIREATKKDLDRLLLLYTQLHDNEMPMDMAGLHTLWDAILADKNHHIIVAEEDGKLVSSCVCVIILNLTHKQRSYALVENVITDEAYRNRGLASLCLQYAKKLSIENNCYKMMLMTGSKKESTLHFYEQAGYNKNDKTAFIQWL
ncbi:MAG TPA: GNAT family N-acetyltransferase [Lachnospiraceae bacterium]|nr:GNAT family N-acetyltransferase [Lachnospiraceae bacterium]